MRLFKSSTFMPVFFIDYRTHLLAQSAIGAFVFINFRIPKSFNINMKFDGLVDTHIPTSIASTTFGFIGYIYHLQVYKIYIIQDCLFKAYIFSGMLLLREYSTTNKHTN